MFLERRIDVKGYLSICNSQIDEKLASVILQQPESLLQRNLNIVLKNKELLGDLTTIGGEPVELMIPNAGCCLFAKLLNKSFNQSIKLVNKLAEVNGYLLYPSSLFYTKIEGVRIGFGSRDFEEFINKNTA
jgi:aspartate/methionine/tyrosine aminotransferase